MPGSLDEKKWNKAKAAFKKSYGKEPKADKDFAIVMSIYKKMTENFDSEIEDYKDLINQFSEEEQPNPYDSEEEEKEVPREEVLKFFRTHPNPNDSTVHDWAKEMGYETDDVEEAIYKIATLMATLKHSEDVDDIYDAEQLKMGIEVEKEHTDDLEVAKTIAKAHLAEIPDYYTRLNKMEKDAKINNEESSKLDSLYEKMIEESVPKELLEAGATTTYPWDKCIADQKKAGHSDESAQKICGFIKKKYGPMS